MSEQFCYMDRTGESEEKRRRRREVQPEDMVDPEAPEGGV